tara:strand:- start:2048 stop:2710 length:663 start_codon:yes stop_codon:yes gene_type:complete
MSAPTSKLVLKDLEQFSAIIFDFDGVIAESVEIKTEAFRDMYSSYGKEISDSVVDHHLINGGMSRFEKFPLYHNRFLGEKLSKEEIQILADQFSDIIINRVISCPLVNGALSLLDFLHAKKLLFISTGTPEDEIKEIVQKRKLKQYFKEVFGSPSSKETHINHILKEYKLKKEETLYIGDAQTDLDAANTSQIDFILRRHKLNADLSNNFKGKIIDDLSL